MGGVGFGGSRMTAREIAERQLMKLKPRTRAKFLRLHYALIGPHKKGARK
jgi:hypothetical protein